MQGERAIFRSPFLAVRVAMAAAVTTIIVIGGLVPSSPSAARPLQPDPRVAPITQVSADGRTGTDGIRTLTVSQAADLEPGGQAIAVAGSGYDAGKGIYVALCVIPPRNVLPTPCGGGVDVEGQAGAAQWISSNPPDYGVGLAQPYGPGGSFSTRFSVRSLITAGIDCRQVRCAVVTRSDHTRTADRSQDLMIPVTFRATAAPGPDPAVPGGGGGTAPGPAPAPGGTTATTSPPTVAVPSTAVPTTAPSRAPEATLAEDGRSVTAGGRTLEVSQARGLDPAGTTVRVRGEGFDERVGVYVSLCRASPDPTRAPGPCATGGERSAWISSTAPDHSRHLATGWGAGGTFDATLELAAEIDADTDCREAPCAVVIRFDDERRDDRTGDLAVPVRFVDASPATTTSSPGSDGAAAEAAGATDAPATDGEQGEQARPASSGDGGAAPLIAAAVVVPAAAGAVIALRRRSRGQRAEPSP